MPSTRLPRPVLTRSFEPETTPPRVRATVGTTTSMACALSAPSAMRPLRARLLKPPKLKSPRISTALVIAWVERPESSRAASSRTSLPIPTGPAVGTTPTAVPVELALKKRPEPPPTVKSLVKTLWPPRESTPPPVTAIGIGVSVDGLVLASREEMLRVGCQGAKFCPPEVSAIGVTVIAAVGEPPSSRVPPAPPVMLAMAEGFWLLAISGSVSVKVPVPTLTVGLTGVLVEPLPPLLLIVRPARRLLPLRVRVDWALRMTRLAGLILPSAVPNSPTFPLPVVRLARLRVIVEFAVTSKPNIGADRGLLRVRTWFPGVSTSIAVMAVPAGMPTPETS